MAKIKDIFGIKTSEDALKWAAKKGAEICEGGNHTIVKGKTGRPVPVPRHKGELPKGTRRAIIREFMAAGLAILVIALAIACF